MPELLYRFRGGIAPTAEAKRGLRAELPASSADGVATLHLYDPIDSWGGWWGVSAKEFKQALDEIGDVTDIHLHINSPGGEVWEAIAIKNMLRNHPAKVTAVVDGLAASAASFLVAGADEAVMGRNTELMIHDAWAICVGAAADMQAMADRLDKASNNVASMYVDKAGGTLESWRALMLAETWYSAEEAVAAGLADRVEGDQADEDTQNAFDLSVFRYRGRSAAPAPVMPPVPQLDPSDQTPAAPAARHDRDVDRRMSGLQARYPRLRTPAR